VDFSSPSATDELIAKLKGQPPMLIIADALADIIGVLDEDKAQHITPGLQEPLGSGEEDRIGDSGPASSRVD
jgi:hypothetical protein